MIKNKKSFIEVTRNPFPRPSIIESSVDQHEGALKFLIDKRDRVYDSGSAFQLQFSSAVNVPRYCGRTFPWMQVMRYLR